MWRQFVAFGLALLIPAVFGLVFQWNPGYIFGPKTSMTVPAVERLLQAEVPTCSYRKDIEVILAKHDISYESFKVDQTIGTDGTELAKSLGLQEHECVSWMRAEIRDAMVSNLTHIHIHIYFFFDKQDRTITRIVRERVIGL